MSPCVQDVCVCGYGCVCVCVQVCVAGVWCACVQGVHIEECFIVLGLLCMHIVLMGTCSSIVTHTTFASQGWCAVCACDIVTSYGVL